MAVAEYYLHVAAKHDDTDAGVAVHRSRGPSAGREEVHAGGHSPRPIPSFHKNFVNNGPPQVLLMYDYLVQSRKSFVAEMEMASCKWQHFVLSKQNLNSNFFLHVIEVLDARFLNGVYRNLPNSTLQLYIFFYVAIVNDQFSLVTLVASAFGVTAMATILNLLYDRKDIRLISLTPMGSNPQVRPSDSKQAGKQLRLNALTLLPYIRHTFWRCRIFF